MSCLTWEDRIEDWIAGLVDDDEGAAVERHVAECEPCRHYEQGARRLRRAVEGLPQERQPGRDLWPDIAERLQARATSGEQSVPTPSPDPGAAGPERRWHDARTWHGGWLAAAALVLVAFGAVAARWSMPVPGGGTSAPGVASSFAVPARVTPADLNLDGDALAAYASARSALVTAIDARRDALQPETVAAVERNLVVIDQAIADIETALRDDPGNPRLERMLLASYRREIDLLQRLAATET